MALTKKMRQHVWDKSGGKCWYCGCELPMKGWHADHFNPVKRGYATETGMAHPENDKLSNIVPACAQCNLFKHSFSIEGFRREIESQVTRALAYNRNVRQALRFGLITIHEKPIIFWFEKQSIGVDE